MRKFDEPREILIPDVLGTDDKNSCPGILRFRIGTEDQVLYPTFSERAFLLYSLMRPAEMKHTEEGRFL